MHDRQEANRVIARQLLEQAKSLAQRQKAIRDAIGLGMSLADIEQHLDWLELVRATIERENHNQ